MTSLATALSSSMASVAAVTTSAATGNWCHQRVFKLLLILCDDLVQLRIRQTDLRHDLRKD